MTKKTVNSWKAKDSKSKLPKLPKLTEAQHQRALVKWARISKIPLIHIPNEGKRTQQEGYLLKLGGLEKGFPDLFLPEARGRYFGLFLEMKQARDYYPSEMETETWITQQLWLDRLNVAGYFAKRAFGWEEGMKIIQHYCQRPLLKLTILQSVSSAEGI